MFVIFVACQVAFWIATWKEYNTGILITNVGQFGVTENHIAVTLAHLLTGIFGQSFWELHLVDLLPQKITSPFSNEIIVQALHLKIGGLIIIGFSWLIFILCLYVTIITILQSKDKTRAISECLTILLIIAFEMIWIRFSFYDRYRGLVLLNFGLISGLITCKTIISYVTKVFFTINIDETAVFPSRNTAFNHWNSTHDWL